MRIVLASSSPRRVELLAAAGYVFDTIPADIDESLLDGEGAKAYVERLARAKAARVLERLLEGEPQRSADIGSKSFAAQSNVLMVIGADTAVVVDDEILGKPIDAGDAARMLRRLSGRTHQVMTGVSVQTPQATVSTVEVTDVSVLPLTDEQIESYVTRGEGLDKAGAYAIQGFAARFMPRIAGSYSNVVGLPIAVVESLIQRLGHAPALLASQG